MLIVISGLPGTGKSAVAEAVARHTGGVQVSIDHIEDALLGAGLPRGRATGVATYEAARAVAEQNLLLGNTIVVDAVNDSEAARGTWRSAAQATTSRVVFVLLTPPEPGEHRRRLAGRVRKLSHVAEPTWAQVEQRARTYEPWSDAPVLVDSAQRPEVVVELVLAALH